VKIRGARLQTWIIHRDGDKFLHLNNAVLKLSGTRSYGKRKQEGRERINGR
jgi:hypothetical protein